MISLKVVQKKESYFTHVFRFDHKETISLNKREEVGSSSFNLEIVDSHWNIFFPDKFRRNESAVILDCVEIILISVFTGPWNDVLFLFRRKSLVLTHYLLIKSYILVVIAASLTVRNAEGVYQNFELFLVLKAFDDIPLIIHVVVKNDVFRVEFYSNGAKPNVNEFRGKYVLVDFWASWCQPCMAQMPNIRYAAQEFSDDLAVCLIGIDENRKQWWSTVKEKDLRNKDATQTDRPYKIYNYYAYDDKKRVMYPEYQALDIQTIPHNYLVDRSGRIIAKNISITLAIDKLKILLEKEKQQ